MNFAIMHDKRVSKFQMILIMCYHRHNSILLTPSLLGI